MSSTKLLSDSDIFKTALAQQVAEIVAGLPSNITSFLESLPNEANGDPIPSSGPYLSAGVIKIA